MQKAPFSAQISQTLQDKGAAICDFNDDEAARGGIVFFAQVTEKLCDFVRDKSHNGFDRVLGVLVNPDASGCVDAWKVLEAGASDVLTCQRDDRCDIAQRIMDRFSRWSAVDFLLTSDLVRRNVIGKSRKWIKTLREIIEISHFSNTSFLVSGESGTGKERIARLIHDLDPRPSKGILTILDCATLVPELSGSEFFGHEKGAFTGAIVARDGAFAIANGGTLFLDEVGELPPELQVKLLRVIQERTYKRVGGNTWYFTDFRLICATNKDLGKAITEGKFRQDLYYRIANWVCELPPLREREEDILLLAEYFFQKRLGENKKFVLDPLLREYFLRRKYPGNVRELEQVVCRVIGKYLGHGPLTIGCVPENDRHWLGDKDAACFGDQFEGSVSRAVFQGHTLKDIGRMAEETAMRIALRDCNGNIRKASEKLGVSERTIQLRKAAGREKYVPPVSDDVN
ncbi:MAG: sigma 54-interacting transcriptional regulator [Thermodesulfobacteriota bacterium]